MALAVASFASDIANDSTATAVVSWSTGDTIVVAGFIGDDAQNINAPTATGLTFTQRSLQDGASTGEAAAGIWTATAGSAGSSVTVTVASSGGFITYGGVWVVSGTVGTITGITASTAEATFSQAVGAGDLVVVAFAIASNAPAKSPATGSGTATERIDAGSVGDIGAWAADWVGVSAGTFGFGASDYSGLAVAQVGVVLSPPAATTEQADFRFGEDDASESAHTWTASQGTDITSPLGQKLIRFLVQATLDPAATAWRLQHQVDGSGGYVDTPVGSAVAEAFGTVTFGAIGTGANGSTTVAPSYPAGITAGQYLTCEVTSGATNSETPTTPSGWTLLATGASTDGTFGVDTGPRRATVFGKEATGSESGTLTVSITNGNTCRGTITRWTKTGGATWAVAGVGAADSTSGTGVSMTFGSVEWHDGDAVEVVTGQRVDSATQSSQSLTATGITFGTRTNRAATAVTTGNDIRHSVDTFAAVSAADPSENAAPTWAYTASAAASAGGVLVRLRAYTAPVTNPVYVATSTNITAGGEATTQRLTGGTGSFTTGRRWDDESGTDTIDVGNNGNTELEFSVATQTLADAQFVDFRLAPIDTYTAVARWTIGSGGDATVTPAAVAATATVPKPNVGAGAAPATVSSVATVPTPTVAIGATVTPAAVAAVATVPKPNVSVGVAPAQVAATSTVPTPTAAIGITATPSVVAVTTTAPAPTVSVGAAPAAVPALTVIGAPAVSVGAAPAAVAAITTVPTPTAGQAGGGGATATPAAVAAIATVPRPDVGVGAAPTSVAAVAAVPTPAALTGAARSPAAVAAVATIPAPAVSVGAAPARVVAVTAMPTPTVFTGSGAAPGTVTALASVLTPAVSVGAAPARVVVLATVPTPTASSGFTATPAAVAALIVVSRPAVSVGVAPSVVAALVAIGIPTVTGSGTELWSWYLSDGATLHHATPLLGGTHPTSTDVGP